MVLEIRPITPDELESWVATTHIGFHVDRSPAVEAAYRRDQMRQDLRRTLAGVDDHQRVAGTLYSYAAELTLPGGACAAVDAVTSVTVLPSHRRRGVLTGLLEVDLRAARERGELAAILMPSEYPIYGRFGFGPATEQATYVVDTAAAQFRRAAEGAVDLVPPAQMRELAPPIFDQVRRARPGQIERQPGAWDARLGLSPAPWASSEHAPRCGVFVAPGGAIEGYLLYRVEGNWAGRLPAGRLEVLELMALTPDAYLGLWRFCSTVDLVRQVSASMRCVDEALPWLLHNSRAALSESRRSDLLWLRPLDVPATLGARSYASPGRLVLDVQDPLHLCGGRFALEADAELGAICGTTDASADLSLGMAALGALVLGGSSPRVLAEAGLIDEQRPGALALAEKLFRWPVAPWCSTFF